MSEQDVFNQQMLYEQQQQAYQQQNYSTQAPPEQNIASVVKAIQQELTSSINDFGHILLGENKQIEISDKGIYKETYKKAGKAICNEKGYWDITAYLMSVANAWSDMEKNEVLKESADITIRFIFDLAIKQEQWGVKKEDRSALVRMFEKFVEYGVLRKISERKMWDLAQHTIQERIVRGEQDRKKTGFSLFGNR